MSKELEKLNYYGNLTRLFSLVFVLFPSISICVITYFLHGWEGFISIGFILFFSLFSILAIISIKLHVLFYNVYIKGNAVFFTRPGKTISSAPDSFKVYPIEILSSYTDVYKIKFRGGVSIFIRYKSSLTEKLGPSETAKRIQSSLTL